MKDLQQVVISVILKNIADGIPFFAYALPGDNTIRMSNDVQISLFGSDAKIVGLNSKALITPLPYDSSTKYDEYVDSVDRIVKRLKADGGKTVISRTIVGRGTLNVDKLFNNTDSQAFRFVYFTKATGLWTGASPELLLKRSPDGLLTTMALAGTMHGCNQGGEWDEKNRSEHNFVVDYIVNCFSRFGLMAKVDKPETVGHASVSHLRHMITAQSDPKDDALFDQLIYFLNPTPALAGWPKLIAEQEINKEERHPRFCYGGYIDFIGHDGVRYAFVNLRSAHFGDGRYCIYTGSGITDQSIPEMEWEETQAKSLTALSMIDRSTDD